MNNWTEKFFIVIAIALTHSPSRIIMIIVLLWQFIPFEFESFFSFSSDFFVCECLDKLVFKCYRYHYIVSMRPPYFYICDDGRPLQ